MWALLSKDTGHGDVGTADYGSRVADDVLAGGGAHLKSVTELGDNLGNVCSAQRVNTRPCRSLLQSCTVRLRPRFAAAKAEAQYREFDFHSLRHSVVCF